MNDAERNDEQVEELSDEDLADDVSVGDLEEAIARARAGGATEQDISDLIANASQGEHVGIESPTEPRVLDELAEENSERAEDGAALQDDLAGREKDEDES